MSKKQRSKHDESDASSAGTKVDVPGVGPLPPAETLGESLPKMKSNEYRHELPSVTTCAPRHRAAGTDRPRWNEYSRARDEMLVATDTEWAPWFIAQSDDQKRARLKVITHLLGQIPCEARPAERIELPDREVDASTVAVGGSYIPTPC